MSQLLFFVLAALFALLVPMVVAHLLLRAVFLLRPPPADRQASFFRASIVGTLALIPAMFFVGVFLFSAIGSDIPTGRAQSSVAGLRILWSLGVFGLLAQLFLGQRLTLIAGSGVARGARLLVERVATGAIHDLPRDDISSLDLYRPWYNYRDRRIQLQLKDGKTIRLFFGETVRADLTTWLQGSAT